MHVLVTGRQEGKTTRFMEWVKGGVKVKDYPGWSRVGVVVDERAYLDVKRQYWGDIEDFDHRVYQIKEFERGHFVSRETLYRIDNFDMVLWDILHLPNLDGFTMTALPWEDPPPPPVDQCPNIFMKDRSIIQVHTNTGWVNVHSGYPKED